MRKYGKSIALGLMISTLFFIISGCKQDTQKKARPVVTVSAIKLAPQTVPVTKTYIGSTHAVSSVDIRARVKGFLIKKNFTEGDFVKKGQLLFEIDPAPFKAKLVQAQAELAQAISDVNFDKLEYGRMKTLYEKKVASKSDFDKASTAYKDGLAKVAKEKADVENSKINLSYCYMYSPIDGKIGETQVDVGNLVGGAQDTLLATVVQLNPIYVQFSPSVSDFGELLEYRSSKPFKVDVTLPNYPKEKFFGAVNLINNQADAKTATVLMRATIDNPENLLLPGLYVNIQLDLGKNADALLVPESAIIDNQGQPNVYLISENSIVKSQKIESQLDYEGMKIISKGLKPGDIVITNNLQKIRPGEKVKYILNKKP